ncbi:MAG: hypothetical protein KY476_09725 [Planctomycetes bacterium]|nr:hypothetical protein [Planctomycetota bacterium]
MRVNDSSNGGRVPGRRPVRSRESSRTERSTAAEGRQRAPEVSELLTQLQEYPDFRPDVVADIERRLKNGDLLSREAAEAAAEAVLVEVESYFVDLRD